MCTPSGNSDRRNVLLLLLLLHSNLLFPIIPGTQINTLKIYGEMVNLKESLSLRKHISRQRGAASSRFELGTGDAG